MRTGSLQRLSGPNSPDSNLLDYYIWGTMLEKHHKLQPKIKMTNELKVTLQTI